MFEVFFCDLNSFIWQILGMASVASSLFRVVKPIFIKEDEDVKCEDCEKLNAR